MGDRQNNSVWVSAVEKIGAGSLSFYIEGKVELRKLCALGMTLYSWLWDPLSSNFDGRRQNETQKRIWDVFMNYRRLW